MSQAKYFRRAKSEWSLAIPSRPTGALGLQKFRVYAIPQLRLALPSQRYRCRIRRRGDPCGRPQAFPFEGGRRPRRGRMRVTSWLVPGGSPKGLPYPDTEGFLAIRRGGAEGELPRRGKRSRPGVCPSRPWRFLLLCRARPPGRAVSMVFAGEVSPPAGGELLCPWRQSNQNATGDGSDEHFVLIVAFPRTPLRGTRTC